MEVEEEEVVTTQEGDDLDESVEEVHVSAVSADDDGPEIITVTTDDLQVTPTATHPRAKQKQYTQKYRRQWEALEFCRGWLMVSSGLVTQNCRNVFVSVNTYCLLVRLTGQQ